MRNKLTRVLTVGPAPSKERLIVQVNLGEHGIRTLTYDGRAMEWLKTNTGRNPLRGEFAPLSVTDVVKFLYACSLTFQPKEGKLTLNELADAIGVQYVKEAFAIVVKLMTNRAEDPHQLAPYVPTHPKVLKEALRLAKLATGEIFLDLGCGDGRALALAHRMGAGAVWGYELDANRALVAQKLVEQVGATGGVSCASIMTEAWLDLHPNVVFCYLLGDAMKALADYAAKLPKGTRLVSHDFAIDGWEPVATQTVKADDREHVHTLYLYEVGNHVARTVDFSKTISAEDAEYVAAGIAEALAELEGAGDDPAEA